MGLFEGIILIARGAILFIWLLLIVLLLIVQTSMTNAAMHYRLLVKLHAWRSARNACHLIMFYLCVSRFVDILICILLFACSTIMLIIGSCMIFCLSLQIIWSIAYRQHLVITFLAMFLTPILILCLQWLLLVRMKNLLLILLIGCLFRQCT